MDALNFNNVDPAKMKKKAKEGAPTKEFEMMFDKVMNPAKYNKKYGHLEK